MADVFFEQTREGAYLEPNNTAMLKKTFFPKMK